jgi:hypothetical protein
MFSATSQVSSPFPSLRAALDCVLRPAVGYQSPDDVLKDPDLAYEEKRSILSSWASDACAVVDRPHLRWLLGSPEPVPLFEVLDALYRLQRRWRRQRCPD